MGKPQGGETTQKEWLSVMWVLEESSEVAVQVGNLWYAIQVWNKHP